MTVKTYGRFLVVFFLAAFTIACNRYPLTVKLFKDHLGKKVDLSGYDFVYNSKQVYSYAEFRAKYPFVTVNYIDEDCAICKIKVREWCDNAEKIPLHENLAHLFVFRGKNFETFLRYSQGKTEFPFFVMSSEEFTYANNNGSIDRQIIDAGFLIDRDNRIKIIGDPFVSEKMKDLYNRVVRGQIK